MILKAIKWFVLASAAVLAIVAILLVISYQLALDSEYRHTAATQALPLYPAPAKDGLLRVAVADKEFRVRTAGCEGAADQAGKPAVILLHGWPVTSAMWLRLIDPLANAGYCVLAPDQRGYSPGARPDTVQDYALDKLVSDVLALADAVGIRRFHLVGHDWGSAIGWGVVMSVPERIITWSALSIPHPAAFARAVEQDAEQRASSSYFLLFRTPWLAEGMFAFADMALYKAVCTGMSKQQTDEYLSVLREPGAMTATFNYYRAMNASTLDSATAMKVATPTLFIWGNADPAVARSGVEWQQDYMTGPYTQVELSAAHWLFVDEPDRVISLISNHIQTHSRHTGRARQLD
ncbi:MAG: alpha/beta fold hydrolase [Halioglobus sp.]